MKKFISLLMFSSVFTVNIIGQDSYSQQEALAYMLSQDKFFEVRQQRKLCGDSIDEALELCYAYKMHGYLNRPDSSAVYLNRLLKEYPHFFGNRDSKVYFANKLLELYSDMGNYSKMLDAYDTVEGVIRLYLSGSDSIWAIQQLEAISQLRKIPQARRVIPQMTVTNLSLEKEVCVSFTEESILTSDIECNGIPLKTWIDTGWGNAVFMTKVIADSCKAREIPLSEDSIWVNDVLVRVHRALIDSLKIGSILFSHVPVIVVHDNFSSFVSDSIVSEEKLQKYNSIMNSTSCIIGLPLLNKLGSILFDWEQRTMKIKLAENIVSNETESNIFIGKSNMLYTGIFINSLRFIGLVDTGAPKDCIVMTKSFYDANKEYLPINEVLKGKNVHIGRFMRIRTTKCKVILEPEVIFDSKVIRLGDEDVIAYQNISYPEIMSDGLVGCEFLKRLGKKVKIDFVNMQIAAD